MGCSVCGNNARKLSAMGLMKNASKSGGRVFMAWFKGEKIWSEEEIVKKRMEVCRKCEFFDKEKVKCRACGCYLLDGPGGLPGKTRLATEKCPHKKW